MAISRGTTSGTDYETTSGIATTMTISKPTAVATDTVLIAQFSINSNSSTISSVPSGWTQLAAVANSTTGLQIFAYYKVVTDGASEPSSYSWTRSGGVVAWSAWLYVYSGVDTTTPLDTTVQTGEVSSIATTFTLSGITTTTDGAQLISGVGHGSTNSGIYPITAPTSWTKLLDITTNKRNVFGDMSQTTAGATGDIVWDGDADNYWVGWFAALRPAGGGGVTGSPILYYARRRAA